MLFLSLLIYLIIWIPGALFIIPALQLTSLQVWLSMLLVYALSILISYLLVYMIHSFNPNSKAILRNTVRIQGTLWIALATAITGIIALLFFALLKSPGLGVFGIMIPLIIVSVLNSLKIEILPKMLEDDEIAPKLVTLIQPETQELDHDIVRKFVWEHKGQTYELELVIRKSVYDEYKSKSRLSSSEWAKEYAAGGICGEVREIVFRLLQIGKPYGTYEEVEFVLSFVQQSMLYTKEEGEYPRYPVESLVDGAGDCEDYSILGASILKLMGYEVALLFLPGHAALGVAGAEGVPGVFTEYKENKYYYCEMTDAGWKIGEMPEQHKNSKIDVFPVPGVVLKIDETVKAA